MVAVSTVQMTHCTVLYGDCTVQYVCTLLYSTDDPLYCCLLYCIHCTPLSTNSPRRAILYHAHDHMVMMAIVCCTVLYRRMYTVPTILYIPARLSTVSRLIPRFTVLYTTVIMPI